MFKEREWSYMQHELNDAGGAKELAGYRLEAAKEDLAAAKKWPGTRLL